MSFCVIGSVQLTPLNSTAYLHLTIQHHDFGDKLSTNTLCISSHNQIFFYCIWYEHMLLERSSLTGYNAGSFGKYVSHSTGSKCLHIRIKQPTWTTHPKTERCIPKDLNLQQQRWQEPECRKQLIEGVYPIQRACRTVVWRTLCQNNWAVSIKISQVFNEINTISLVSLSTWYNFSFNCVNISQFFGSSNPASSSRAVSVTGTSYVLVIYTALCTLLTFWWSAFVFPTDFNSRPQFRLTGQEIYSLALLPQLV